MSYNYKDKNFSTKAITFSCDADIIYVWHVLINRKHDDKIHDLSLKYEKKSQKIGCC